MTAQSDPLWYRRWFQYLILSLLLILLVSLLLPPLLQLIYMTRSVLLPAVIALAMAYIVNPLVRYANKRAGLPRQLSAGLLLLLAAVLIAGLLVYLLPRLIGQVEQLIRKIPDYADYIVNKLNLDMSALGRHIEHLARSTIGSTGPASDPSSQSIDLGVIFSTILNWLDIGYEVVSSTIGLFSYLILAIVIICFCFFFFVWKFDPIVDWFAPFIPAAYRGKTFEVICKMDRTVSAFIRGRLIQAMVVMVVLSIGWAIAGVPYWLLLGILGGILNLIPYAAVFSWPVAVLLAWLDSISPGQAAQFSIWGVLIWPTAVYFAAQLIDNWVVEPLVQGKATEMDPLTVMLVVLLGASIAGLLGMLLAIPVAACIKILAQEIALPKLRQLAATGNT